MITPTVNAEVRPDLETIRAALQRIRPHIHRTPVLTSRTMNEMAGAQVFFKCENLQKGGAFKARGAINAVLSLDEAEAAKGVITHSSGNHGAALSMAARIRGIKAYIVVPSNTPAPKVGAIRNYGGEITFCKPTLEARESTTDELIAGTGAVLIHPYNDYRVIAGQGTCALELHEQVEEGLDMVLAPVGGGGLISGTSLAMKGLSPGTRIIGCEPTGADDAYQSKQAGKIIPQTNPHTIADGLRSSLERRPFRSSRNSWTRLLRSATKRSSKPCVTFGKG